MKKVCVIGLGYIGLPTACILASKEFKEKLTSEMKVNIISISRDFQYSMLYHNAIILGIPLFVKDYDRFLSLKLEAIYQAEDFELFGVRWQQEIATCKEISFGYYNNISKRFPANEQYGLISQINRAVISVASNLAEGT